MKRALLTLALLLAAAPAHAHKLKLFVSLEGAVAVGTAYFAGGGKAAGLDGRVLDSDGTAIATLRTDAEGAFRFTPPDGRAYRIRFESGDGHMAEATIGAAAAAPAIAAAPTAVAAPVDNTALEAAIASQLTPLRQQIDALDSRARLSDIVGGLGLIFGLFGGYAWIASRRRDKTP